VRGGLHEVDDFLRWMESLPHAHKILVAGNHDWLFQRSPDLSARLLAEHPGITYLRDSGCQVGGLQVRGSQWQPSFGSWAFNLPRGLAIRDKWGLIPIGIDILVTHGPPMGVLDQTQPKTTGDWKPGHRQPVHLGCEELLHRLKAVSPRLHVFGHIHGGHGIKKTKRTISVNASICDERNQPLHAPIVLDLEPHPTVTLPSIESQ
jgi:hypothetical protein